MREVTQKQLLTFSTPATDLKRFQSDMNCFKDIIIIHTKNDVENTISLQLTGDQCKVCPTNDPKVNCDGLQ